MLLDQKLLKIGSELMGVYVGVVGIGQIGHTTQLHSSGLGKNELHGLLRLNNDEN